MANPVQGIDWRVSLVDSSGAVITGLPTTGTKTNNNAAPGADNLGALVGIANAVAPTYTEGNEVLLSTTLGGLLRVTTSTQTVNVAGTTSGGSAFVGPSVAIGMVGAGGTHRNCTGANSLGSTTGNDILGVGNLLKDAISGNYFNQAGDPSGRAMAVGAAATGAAVTGNPVLIGVSDGTNVQTLMTESSTRFNLRTAIFNGLSEANVLTPGDGGASGTVLGVDAFQSDWNGATYDRHRSSQDVILHASAVTGTGTVNTDVTTYNYSYLVIHANVTLYNGGTVLFKVQMQDANAVFVDIPLATTGAVASGADIFLTVGPTTWGANATPVFYANQMLPRTIRIVQTVAGASVTFSAAYCLKN